MSVGIQSKISTAFQRLSVAIEKTKPVAVFGLFSGGHDSFSASFIASLSAHFTGAVHINTGFGIEDTRRYVRSTCEIRGWKLFEYCATENVNANGDPDQKIYEEMVLKSGFPGSSGHQMMYNQLKERQLRRLQRDWKCRGYKKRPRRIMYVSGCRSQESDRRMRHTDELQVDGQRIWCAPIHDWTKLDTSELLQVANQPRNLIVDLIHKSGECMCGAYAKKGELEELALWPQTKGMYSAIKSLEERVKKAGFPWGWEDQPPKEYLEEKRGQMMIEPFKQFLYWKCNANHANHSA